MYTSWYVVKINERAQTAITSFFALTSETLFLIIFVGLSVNINPRPTTLPVYVPLRNIRAGTRVPG